VLGGGGVCCVGGGGGGGGGWGGFGGCRWEGGGPPSPPKKKVRVPILNIDLKRHKNNRSTESNLCGSEREGRGGGSSE